MAVPGVKILIRYAIFVSSATPWSFVFNQIQEIWYVAYTSTRATRKQSTSEINKSAVTDHCNSQNHVINWDLTKIVDKKTNLFRRRLRESIAICKSMTTMNRDAGTYQLPHVYDSLLLRKL